MDTSKPDMPGCDWRDELPTESFRVLYQEATERAFTSPLYLEQREGWYVCAGCHQPLFSSANKYESGSGWPSFHTAQPDSVATRTDFKLVWPRTEYHCSRCGGHQGHVFRDGPQPSGLRYCNNGVALRFIPLGEVLPEIR
jgi:peptide-methionine (R)-S-oxide reductase